MNFDDRRLTQQAFVDDPGTATYGEEKTASDN